MNQITRSTRWVSLLALTSLLGLGAATARATIVTLYTNDFESLSTGLLTPQAGWVNSYFAWGGVNVTTGPGGSADTTKVLTGNLSGSANGNTNSIAPLVFTTGDTNVEQSLWAYRVDAAASATAGLLFSANGSEFWNCLFGVNAGTTIFNNAYAPNPGNYASYSGDTLTAGDWYEMKLAMNFSVLGGKATLSYRDITTAGAWITDATIQNVNMNLTPVLGTYTADGLSVRIDSNSGHNYLDNFSVTETIPEPSTVLLLLCGSGLLAWKARGKR